MWDKVSSLGSKVVQNFRQMTSLIVVLVIWELLVQIQILDYRFFPTPTKVIETLFQLTASGELLIHIAASLQRVILGFAVGSFFGLVIGLMIGWSKFVEQLIDPLISAIYPIPKLALLPLIMIILGIGEASKVAIVAIAVFFTVVINTAAGVRNIEPVYLDAARNLGAKGMRMFISVVIPAALPTIFTGLRLGLGLGLVVIIAAEFVAANQGVGYMIWLAWRTLATKKMYAGLIVIGLLGLLSSNVLLWLGRKLMPWNVSDKQSVLNRSERRGINGARFSDFLIEIPALIFSYSRQYLYELPNHVDLDRLDSDMEGIELKWIDKNNVDAIRPWKGWNTSRRFQIYLNKGMIGIYAFSDDVVVGFIWGAVKTSRFASSCSQFPIEVGDGFALTTEVIPEFRRRGVASLLRYTLLMQIRQLSPNIEVRRVCGTVILQNTPVQKLIEKQGSIRIQEMMLFRMTPWIYFYWILNLDGKGDRMGGSGRLRIQLRAPEILYDPLMQKTFGRMFVYTKRVWQPKGGAYL